MGSKYNEVRTDVDTLFDRTRDIENQTAQFSIKLDTVIANQIKSDEIFSRHDTKEMAKYDTQDGHVVEINNTLKDVQNTLGNVVTSQETILDKLASTDDRLDVVERKQNKFITMFSTIVLVVGIAWTVGTWTAGYMKDQSTLKAQQLERVEVLEKREAHRYAEMELLKKYIIKDD